MNYEVRVCFAPSVPPGLLGLPSSCWRRGEGGGQAGRQKELRNTQKLKEGDKVSWFIYPRMQNPGDGINLNTVHISGRILSSSTPVCLAPNVVSPANNFLLVKHTTDPGITDNVRKFHSATRQSPRFRRFLRPTPSLWYELLYHRGCDLCGDEFQRVT